VGISSQTRSSARIQRGSLASTASSLHLLLAVGKLQNFSTPYSIQPLTKRVTGRHTALTGICHLTFTTFTTFPERLAYRIRWLYNPVPTQPFPGFLDKCVRSFVPSSRISKP
jgi:hypothetical protein